MCNLTNPDLFAHVQCEDCFWEGILAQTLYSDARGPLCPQCKAPLESVQKREPVGTIFQGTVRA